MFIGSRNQLINALESMPIRAGVTGQHIAKAAADEIRIIDKIHKEIMSKRYDTSALEDRWDRGYAAGLKECADIVSSYAAYEATK